MDLENYYTALPDDNSELAVFVKNGFFSYRSTEKENQAPQTLTHEEESQDVLTPTKFMLSNITIAVTKVRIFKVLFLSRVIYFCVVSSLYLGVLGLRALHKELSSCPYSVMKIN